MKIRIVSTIFLIGVSLCVFAAQGSENYVDVQEVNVDIELLNRVNVNHTNKISENRIIISELENHILVRNERLSVIEENLVFVKESNLELNNMFSETNDQKTKDKITKCRSEILSILWLLDNEKKLLIDQNIQNDSKKNALANDIVRRETLIELNLLKISKLDENLSVTESRILAISTTIDEIDSRLLELRKDTEQN